MSNNDASSVLSEDQKHEDIIEQIVEATKEQHAQLDEHATSFLSRKGLTLDAYRRLLEVYYGFYKSLDTVYEQIAQLEGWQEVNLTLREREKGHWLEQDLRVLGNSEEAIAALPLLHAEEYQVTSVAQALGLLYVIEGSTLGGQYLARIVEKSLHLDANTGSAFFRSYGPQQAQAMWKSFCQRLGVYASLHLEQREQIIASAIDVYAVANRWLVVPEA